VLGAVPDAVNLTLDANHAAGLLGVLCYCQATHSIQA